MTTGNSKVFTTKNTWTAPDMASRRLEIYACFGSQREGTTNVIDAKPGHQFLKTKLGVIEVTDEEAKNWVLVKRGTHYRRIKK